jgi:REP element-mobilizing transposase RayT
VGKVSGINRNKYFVFPGYIASMSVRKKITEPSGVFFITFTCARWLPLFKMTNGYHVVYKWFDYLKGNGHHIVGYVIMPGHVHVLIAFSKTQTSINTIIGNGKRFMAYELVKLLQARNRKDILEQMQGWVNATEKMQHKKHEVFEPSFDRKECYSIRFMEQKVNYIHLNPCKEQLAKLPEDYTHSSAKYYYTGVQGVYPVITCMELQDIDLS